MVEKAPPLPFDAVEVDEGESSSRLSVNEFLAIPLRTRVRLLLGQRLRFKSGDALVDAKLALAAIYASTRSAAPSPRTP